MTDCRRCKTRLSMCDIDIHPWCKRAEDQEKNPKPIRETEFDRGFIKYPYVEPVEVA